MSLFLGGCALAASAIGVCAAAAPLQLEAKIALGSVRGRIDHLTIDLARQRLFVAELGNDSVAVIDLKAGQKPAHGVRNLSGLHEPQGLGFDPATDTLYVANGADGSVRLFHGPDLLASGAIALGADADNVRVDTAGRRVFVGYGSGALAVIDADHAAKIADIPLRAHPESFRLGRSDGQIFVNVPDAHEIVVIDRADRKQIQRWQTGGLSENFPMALDEARGQVLVAFREPAKLALFRAADGRLLGSFDTCRDSDDLFVDSKRARVYVLCGEGAVDVFDLGGERPVALGRIRTSAGARTGLYVQELDRLFIAVRATADSPAAVWVYRPTP